MAFNTDWNIEKYKSPFECEEHWELRKTFLVAHKNKYPEDQLVCLAQVFFNVELLGCKYPDETMELVAKLSEGIADSFREKKQQKLQRTFIKASDAAGAKIKGLLPTAVTVSSDLITAAVSSEVDMRLTSTATPNSTCTAVLNSDINTEIDTVADKAEEYFSVNVVDLFKTKTLYALFRNFVIWKTLDENFVNNGTSILQRSMAKKNFNLQYTYEKEETAEKPKWKCVIFIQNQYVADAVANSKQASRRAVSAALLSNLQNICYTVVEKVRVLSDGTTVKKDTDVSVEEPEILESSIGNKIMKSMGWKGGGLGKTEQGRVQPVMLQDRVNRSGLGVNLTEVELMKKLNNKLRTYAASHSNYDLVFSNDFSKEERAKLHTIAQKLCLKTRSYGSGSKRHLVVSKRLPEQGNIIHTLLSCGGENERYRLILPSNF